MPGDLLSERLSHVPPSLEQLVKYMAAGGRRDPNNPYGMSSTKKSSDEGTEEVLPRDVSCRIEIDDIRLGTSGPVAVAASVRGGRSDIPETDMDSEQYDGELTSEDLAMLYGSDDDGSLDDTTTEDSHTPDDSGLGFLRTRLTVDSWDKDKDPKDFPRYILSILIEDLMSSPVDKKDDKIAFINEFICQLKPYTMKGKKISRSDTRDFHAIRKLVEENFESDYDDFTVCQWTHIFGLAINNPDIRLSPEAKAHIHCQWQQVPDETIKDWVKDGERDAIPPHTPPRYARLIATCWAQRAEDRPQDVRAIADELAQEDIMTLAHAPLDSGYAYKSF